jgi:hypothetical protein
MGLSTFTTLEQVMFNIGKSTSEFECADKATELVTPWKHWGDPTDNSNYFHVPAVSPREAFQSLIDKFRGLEFLGTPPFMEFNDDLFLENGRTPPEDWDQGAKVQFRVDFGVWKAKRKLADFYLECGWDVHAVEQPDFRRAEFITRREVLARCCGASGTGGKQDSFR